MRQKDWTETDWLRCTELGLLFRHLQWRCRDWKAEWFGWLGYRHRQLSARKVRLLACACCRRIWHLLPEEGRQAVEASEYWADAVLAEGDPPRTITYRASASAAERAVANAAIGDAKHAAGEARVALVNVACREAKEAARRTRTKAARGAAYQATTTLSKSTAEAERKAQCDLIRDVFGNPCKPATIPATSPLLRDPLLRGMAQSIYEERRFEEVPILADALEDAGCRDEAILSHCRRSGPHVRGCWALDLLLGKE